MIDMYLVTGIIVAVAVLSAYTFMVSVSISNKRRLAADRLNNG